MGLCLSMLCIQISTKGRVRLFCPRSSSHYRGLSGNQKEVRLFQKQVDNVWLHKTYTWSQSELQAPLQVVIIRNERAVKRCLPLFCVLSFRYLRAVENLLIKWQIFVEKSVENSISVYNFVPPAYRGAVYNFVPPISKEI